MSDFIRSSLQCGCSVALYRRVGQSCGGNPVRSFQMVCTDGIEVLAASSQASLALLSALHRHRHPTENSGHCWYLFHGVGDKCFSYDPIAVGLPRVIEIQCLIGPWFILRDPAAL